MSKEQQNQANAKHTSPTVNQVTEAEVHAATKHASGQSRTASGTTHGKHGKSAGTSGGDEGEDPDPDHNKEQKDGACESGCTDSGRLHDKTPACGCADPSGTPSNSACDAVDARASELPSTLTPEAAAMAEEMYREVTMATDAYLHLLPHVRETAYKIKTDMTAALCYYEKLAGKIKDRLVAAGITPKEGGMMAKMSARAGMAMNAAMDRTDSHLVEMLIEGCNMSVTTATKLANHAAGKPGCELFVELCREWAQFEERHVEALKKYL